MLKIQFYLLTFHCNEVEEGGRCSLILVFQVIMVYKLKERGIDSIQLQSRKDL